MATRPTSFGYDSQGNRTSITPPSQLGKTTLTYDGLSRVTSVTDGNGHTTQYSYDNEDRLLKLTYADDADGNVLTEVDSTGTTSFQYDKLNHLINKTLPGGTVIATGYDAVGNLTSINDGTGTINYTYDAANRMITLTDVDGSKTTYNYDADNHKISILYPNATGMVMTYDKAGHELSTIGGIISTAGGAAHVTTPYDNFQYTYTTGSGSSQKPTALVQQVTYLDEIHQSSTSHQIFTYDSQNQLTDAKNYNSGNTLLGEWTYSYDANGNITRKGNQSGTLTNYSYNAANELTTSSVSGGSTTSYSYDGNGNQTASTAGLSVSYNAANQATTMNGTSNTYTGADQSQRVQAGTTTAVYSQLGLGKPKAPTPLHASPYPYCGLIIRCI